MNNYQLTRLADLRLQETARQARTAWWRQQRPAVEHAQVVTSPSRLHWGVPMVVRSVGA
jgi:hypothetical protein